MTDHPAGQAARQMVERQLEELGSLYNAGVRSPMFREWRQATLTCIQRIWPADPAKSERFRRIPFSPPMGRPGEREVREYYERGCGEAASLLKELIAEVASAGIAGPPAAPSHAMGASHVPGIEDDGIPTVDLPGSGSASPAADAARDVRPAAGAGGPSPSSKPRLKDLLGFSDGPDLAGGTRGTTDLEAALAAATGPAPAAPPPAPTHPGATPSLPGLERPGHSPATHGTPPGPQATPGAGAHTIPGLESQGFFAPPTVTREVPGHAPGHAATPAPGHSVVAAPGHAAAPPHGHAAPAPGHTPAPPAASPTRIVVTGPELAAGGPAPPPDLSARGLERSAATPAAVPAPAPSPEASRIAEAAARDDKDPDYLERIAEELLRATSAIGSVPRRTGQDRRTNPREIKSPIAIAVAALALEVEALGVPEGHRARARAVLLDLSRALDGSNLQWTALREATSFVMEFPGLGRRVVPLLLPYFDRAA